MIDAISERATLLKWSIMHKPMFKKNIPHDISIGSFLDV
jgi:hypothetical protein